MKFAVVVVVLALAFGIESSLLSYRAPISPLSYTAVSGPSFYGAYDPAFVGGRVPVVSGYSSSFGAPLPYVAAPYVAAPYVAAPAPYVAAPTPYVAAPLIAGEGSYVAQNRGAVHVAPLPGHVNSAASINLEPAPGTL